MKRRSKLALTSAIIATIMMLIDVIVLGSKLSALDLNDTYTMLGATIGVGMLMPHFVAFLVGVVINWCGYAAKERGFCLAAGVLYTLAMTNAMNTWLLTLTPAILCYIDYGLCNPKRLRRLERERRLDAELEYYDN